MLCCCRLAFEAFIQAWNRADGLDIVKCIAMV